MDVSQEKRDKFNQVERLRKQGKTAAAACKESGMHVASYYELKKKLGGIPINSQISLAISKAQLGKRKSPTLHEIELQPPTPTGSVQLIIGSPQDVAEVIKSLR